MATQVRRHRASFSGNGIYKKFSHFNKRGCFGLSPPHPIGVTKEAILRADVHALVQWAEGAVAKFAPGEH